MKSSQCLASYRWTTKSSPARAGGFAVVAAALAVSVFCLSPAADAANMTWQNTGTDFNTSGNWTTATPGTGDVAVFAAAQTANPTLSSPLTIQELNFSTIASSGYDLTSSDTSMKLTLTNTGGTATTSAISAANTTGTNTIDAPVVLGAAASATQTFSQAGGGTLVVNGVISSTNAIAGLSLNGASGSTVTLTGSNTYSGNTSVVGGQTLNLNNATAISSGALGFLSAGSAVTIDNTTANPIILTNNNPLNLTGTLNFGGTKDLSFGTGAVTLIGVSRTIATNGTANLILNGAIGDGGSGYGLTKTGLGTLTLGGANTFTGGIYLSGGILNINNANTLGPVAGTGAFNLNSATAVIDNTSASAVTLTSNNLVTLTSSFAYSTSTGTAANSLTFGTGAVIFSGPRTITLNGAGSLTFAGKLTQTNTVAARTLTVNNGSGTTASSSVTFGGYVLTPTGAASAFTEIMDGTGRVNITGDVTDGTFANSGLAYSGTGILTRSGADTYSGTTTVNRGSGGGGAMFVNGTHTNAGAYTVTTGNTLGGNGSITTAGNAAVTLSTGAKLSPGQNGSSIGTLSFDTGTAPFDITGAVNATASASMLFDLGATGDKVVLTNVGVLSIGSGKLNFDDFVFTARPGLAAGTYTLFHTSNTIVGTLGTSLTGTVGGFNAELATGNSGQDIVLITTIPEPVSFAIMGMAMAGLLARRKHRVC